MTMGDRIKAARGAKSQADFARDVGVSLRAIQYWEAGKRKPRIDQVAKLCDATDLSIEYLLYGDKDKVVA